MRANGINEKFITGGVTSDHEKYLAWAKTVPKTLRNPLYGSYDLLEKRIVARSHQFMEKDLLRSQLDTLEEPKTGLTVYIADTPQQICQKIMDNLIR